MEKPENITRRKIAPWVIHTLSLLWFPKYLYPLGEKLPSNHMGWYCKRHILGLETADSQTKQFAHYDHLKIIKMLFKGKRLPCKTWTDQWNLFKTPFPPCFEPSWRQRTYHVRLHFRFYILRQRPSSLALHPSPSFTQVQNGHFFYIKGTSDTWWSSRLGVGAVALQEVNFKPTNPPLLRKHSCEPSAPCGHVSVGFAGISRRTLMVSLWQTAGQVGWGRGLHRAAWGDASPRESPQHTTERPHFFPVRSTQHLCRLTVAVPLSTAFSQSNEPIFLVMEPTDSSPWASCPWGDRARSTLPSPHTDSCKK